MVRGKLSISNIPMRENNIMNKMVIFHHLKDAKVNLYGKVKSKGLSVVKGRQYIHLNVFI